MPERDSMPTHRIGQRNMHLPNMKLLTPIRAVMLMSMSMLVMGAYLMELAGTVVWRHPFGRAAVATYAHADAVDVFALGGVVGGRHDVAFAAELLDSGVDVRVLFGAFDRVGPVVGVDEGGCCCQGECK